MEPKISVALVTRNRPESLERTLTSLRAQSAQPFEVIVSDDSDAEFVPRIMAIAEKFQCTYRPGPKRGLYANRNSVALACSGSHVRTMDDDHTFPDGHWEACAQAVVEAPDTVWTISEYVPTRRPEDGPPNEPGQLHPRGFSVAPADPEEYWGISDGASIYPKSIFEAGHLYAEYFIFGAAYLEFGSRLKWLGYTLRNLRTTYVDHNYHESARSVMNAEVDLSSRVFAMLCHSFRYQRSIKNASLTSLQIAWEIIRGGTRGARCVRRGMRAFREFASP